jgi:amidophosphoribosyltransferase
VLQTTFDLSCDDVKELEPGTALLVKRNGQCSIERIIEQKSDSKCSFERIYFSRGNDRDIYKERKQLGEQLTEPVLRAINYDTEHTVFSFIPNTAEVAFYGMLDGFKRYVNEKKIDRIQEVISKNPSREELASILNEYVRTEKVAWKDIKLRTFITESNSRNDLAAHVYDITYGSIRPHIDNLVIIDDSIVRGTTLRESIIRILDRLHPKKIVIVSSSPQVRYPDYYGIDMAKMSEFIAFRATIELIRATGQESLLKAVYDKCKAQAKRYDELFENDLDAAIAYKSEMKNYVKEIYHQFTPEEISAQMVRMLRSPEVESDIEIVFQSLEGLHKACPNHQGDWYFSGDYPTPGGVRLVNQAYIDWYENNSNELAPFLHFDPVEE